MTVLYILAVLTTTSHGEAALSAGIWFWLFYVFCFFFSGWAYYPYGQPQAYRPFAGMIVIYILLGLLGWGVFGPPIK